MKETIVTGGRDYDNGVLVKEVLDFINSDMVIQGGAAGADKLVSKWAEENKKFSIMVEAEWAQHGRTAGPIRNREPLRKYPGAVVIVFPGGNGTANCIKQARELGRIVLRAR